MVNHQFNIFFSWQTDIEGNRTIIRKSIKKACEKLNKNYGYDINIDEATRGMPGAPNIEEAVKGKIESCDVFIADISPITKFGDKQIPNPNVLFELGYAMRCVEVARVILVAKKDDYKDCELPFDINHQRIGKFDGQNCDLDFEIGESIKYVLDNGKFQYVRFFNDLHLKQNVNIGKYLPDVFLEDSEFKECLRYFVSPFTFYPKLYHEAEKLNFDYYNQACALKGRNILNFSVTGFSDKLPLPGFSDATKQLNSLLAYLGGKIFELEQQHSNSAYFAQRKIKKIAKGVEYLQKKICLIKGKAGQGKTNLVCDLVENVILKRHIPFVYLNGNEIDANNIGNTIVHSLYPEENYSLGDMLNYIQRFCAQQNKPLIIIVDGLNEHGDPALLKANLQLIINALMQYDFIRFIFTCRTEYYNANFSDLLQSFQNEVVEYESYSHISEDECETLIDNYCNYFNITANFTDDLKREFQDNLLLLRIYCETYKNQNVGFVNHIKKDAMFLKYFEEMQKSLASSLKSIRKEDISLFMRTLVQLMLEKDAFSNISILDILQMLSPDQKEIFYQFLDANILIKRELNESLFGEESISFTFDEFRDFMISHYLVDTIYDINRPDTFIEYVSRFTAENHILREGLTCFLYCYSKENKQSVFELLKKQDWYKESFIKYIWEIDEKHVNDDDISLLKKMIVSNPKIAKRLIYNGRLNTNHYRKINVDLLVEILTQFDDKELEIFLDTAWPDTDGDRIFQTRESTRERFISSIESWIKEIDISQKEYWYKILMPVVFLSPFSWNAKDLLRESIQLDQAKISAQLQYISKETKSQKIKNMIDSL